jgi:hypothetical protein
MKNKPLKQLFQGSCPQEITSPKKKGLNDNPTKFLKVIASKKILLSLKGS